MYRTDITPEHYGKRVKRWVFNNGQGDDWLQFSFNRGKSILIVNENEIRIGPRFHESLYENWTSNSIWVELEDGE